MPRYRRQIAEGSVQHVISRFVNRERRLDAEGARDEYLRRAARALLASDWRALCFALMGSHVHWAMQAGRRPSSAVIQPLHSGFASWLNATEGRLGPVFADRHRTLTFQAETAAALLAYIHNNPVRAGLVTDPADSTWTSHRAYVGLVPAPPWLDVKRGLALSGFSATPSGRLAFHEMVRAGSADARRTDLSGGDMQSRRRIARALALVPVELATPTISLAHGTLQVGAPLARELDDASGLRPAWRGGVGTVLELIAHVTGTERSQLQSRSRLRQVSHARRLALLMWTRELRRPAVELTRVLGLSSSSAAELMSTASAGACAMAAALGRRLRAEEEQEGSGGSLVRVNSEKPRTVP